ncbi:cytochrome B6, partial [Pseudomonas sp. SIMBA_067]
GDTEILSKDEKYGYARFQEYGCIACHQGVNIGGNMLQKFGVLGDFFADRGNPTPADLGRFNVTGDEEDRHVFKVPSLRNVAV